MGTDVAPNKRMQSNQQTATRLMIADVGRYVADPDRSTHTIIRKQQSYADDM